MSKLNELADKAMGWPEQSDIFIGGDKFFTDETFTVSRHFDPSTDLNDAAELLEKVATRGWWQLQANKNNEPEQIYWVDLRGSTHGAYGQAKTAPLAMTLCALRAFGIPEQELQEALK